MAVLVVDFFETIQVANNDAYWDSLDNHADQLNPNNDEYRGDDREDNEDDEKK